MLRTHEHILPIAPVLQGKAWRSYNNEQAQLSLRYPAMWKLESVPTMGPYFTDRLYGPQGSIEVTWGDGIGGACSDNGRLTNFSTVVFNEHTFQVCHVHGSAGEEYWSQMSIDPADGSGANFEISASAKSPARIRRTVLRVLSTLKIY